MCLCCLCHYVYGYICYFLVPPQMPVVELTGTTNVTYCDSVTLLAGAYYITDDVIQPVSAFAYTITYTYAIQSIVYDDGTILQAPFAASWINTATSSVILRSMLNQAYTTTATTGIALPPTMIATKSVR